MIFTAFQENLQLGIVRSRWNPGLNPESASETWHFERSARATRNLRRAGPSKTKLAFKRLRRSRIHVIESIANSIAQLASRGVGPSCTAAAQRFALFEPRRRNLKSVFAQTIWLTSQGGGRPRSCHRCERHTICLPLECGKEGGKRPKNNQQTLHNPEATR